MAEARKRSQQISARVGLICALVAALVVVPLQLARPEPGDTTG